MSLKSIILVTNFQKSPSIGGSPPQALFNLQYWWPKVLWFGKIVVFQADCDETELQKMYDVITNTITSPK